MTTDANPDLESTPPCRECCANCGVEADEEMTALSAWCARQPAASVEIKIGGRSASCLLSKLGQRSALKEWQVQRVLERIREFIGWPRSMHHDDSVYVFMEECGADWEPPGDAADIALAVAIDLMFPCNWHLVDNLDIVLGAIGGELHIAQPLAVCARNIRHAPIRERMQTVCRTLQYSLQNQRSDDAGHLGVVEDAVDHFGVGDERNYIWQGGSLIRVLLTCPNREWTNEGSTRGNGQIVAERRN